MRREVSPSQKPAPRDARRSAVRSGGARSSDARSRAGLRLGLPACDASTAPAAAAQGARHEGAHDRLLAAASAEGGNDGTSGRREHSASALDQRHVCAGAAHDSGEQSAYGWGGNVPSHPAGFPTAIRDKRNALMSFHKPTGPLAVVAAAIVIGGGAYGIVSATASSGSATTTAATSSTRSGQSVAHRPRPSRSARSRRTTVRGRGQSSAAKQRTRRPKLPWSPTPAASLTGL
jgi:hypothetical protein